MSKDKNHDIFKEAAKQAIKKESSIVEQKPTQEELAQQLVDRGDDNWKLLVEAMEGHLAEKFLTIMNSLPDKEFARNYLKLLEYVKPKMVRMENKPYEDQDNTIKIEVTVRNESGELETIDITDLQDFKKSGE